MRKKRNTLKAKPIRIKKILVPLDFSECSSNALREAIFMARVLMAEIELIHVITPVYITSTSYEALVPYDSLFYKRLMKHASKRLAFVAAEIETKEAIKVRFKTSLNVVYGAILSHAKKINADLIIMGAHGTSGIKEFFVGSNAYRVVSEAECPVITVQKRITKKGFNKIVLPVRAELNSRQKVNLVATLAKAFMATILITGYVKNNDPVKKRKVKLYMKQVETFLAKEAINFKSTFISNQNFTKAIIQHAKINRANLIAIMKNHDFGFDQLLTGPYAQQFVNHSSIPVLSVPNTLEFEYTYENPLTGGLTG